jgi:capsular polysaccharide transport system ATP-binding protein
MIVRPAIAFEGVAYKKYGAAEPQLRDLNVLFPADRWTAVLAMQSVPMRSLVNLITGAVRPTEGRIRRDCRVSFPIGYAQGLARHMSGEANTEFLARIYGADIDKTIDFVRDFSELGAAFGERVTSYSAEQRSQFFIAISYAIPFDLYVSSGALIAGASHFRQKCIAYVRDLRTRAGMVITTKSPVVARMYCDAVCVIQNDTIVAFDDMRTGLRYFGAMLKRAQTIEAADLQEDDDDDVEPPIDFLEDI